MRGSSSVESSSTPSGRPPRCSPCPSPPGCTSTARGPPRGRRGKAKGKRPGPGRARGSGSRRPPRPRRIPIIAPGRNWPWDSSIWWPGGSPMTRSSSWAIAPTAGAASRRPRPPTSLSSARGAPPGARFNPALPQHPKTPAAPPQTAGRPRKKGDRLPGLAEWAADPKQPWERLDLDQFGLHAALEVKTIRALYYKAGRDRLLTIVLVHDVQGKRPDQMFYCTKLDWTARQVLSAYACRWA